MPELFTEMVMKHGYLEVLPVGNPKAFLKLTELASGFVANDLANNIYAYSNACEIQELDALSENLTAYNLYGDRSVWRNDRWAITSVREILESIGNDINACRFE